MPDMSQHDIREFMTAFRDNVGGHIDLEFDNGPGHLQCLVDGESRALAPTSMPASRFRSHVMQTTATTRNEETRRKKGGNRKETGAYQPGPCLPSASLFVMRRNCKLLQRAPVPVAGGQWPVNDACIRGW